MSVTELVKSKNLVTKVDEKRDTLVADTEKVSEQIQQILNNTKTNMVIEGHYVVDVVPETQVTLVFVLRRDPTMLKVVLEERGYAEKKVWENLSSEVLDVCLLDAVSACGANKVCEIDVTDKTVDEVVQQMLLVIEKEQPCKIGIVDWLAKLERDGKLEQYMQNF